MDDVTTIIVVISCIVMFGGYLFGLYSNLFWRCKQARSFLKKNFVIICLLDKDRRSMVMSMVDALKGKIRYRDFSWYITDGSIWRAIETASLKTDEKKDVKDSSRLLSGEPQKHYFLDKIVFEEGVPIVFLDMDTLTPVGFETAQAKVKANEISAFLQADWLNEYAKMQAQNKNLSMMLVVTIIVVLANIVINYVMIGGESDKVATIQGQTGLLPKINDNINLIMAKEGLLPQGATLQNGTIVMNVK